MEEERATDFNRGLEKLEKEGGSCRHSEKGWWWWGGGQMEGEREGRTEGGRATHWAHLRLQLASAWRSSLLLLCAAHSLQWKACGDSDQGLAEDTGAAQTDLDHSTAAMYCRLQAPGESPGTSQEAKAIKMLLLRIVA